MTRPGGVAEKFGTKWYPISAMDRRYFHSRGITNYHTVRIKTFWGKTYEGTPYSVYCCGRHKLVDGHVGWITHFQPSSSYEIKPWCL